MVRFSTVVKLGAVTLVTLLALGWIGVVIKSAKSVRNYQEHINSYLEHQQPDDKVELMPAVLVTDEKPDHRPAITEGYWAETVTLSKVPVTVCHYDQRCTNVHPPTRLDIIGVPNAAECETMGATPWWDDTVGFVCIGADY